MKTLVFWFYFLRIYPMAYWQPRRRERSAEPKKTKQIIDLDTESRERD